MDDNQRGKGKDNSEQQIPFGDDNQNGNGNSKGEGEQQTWRWCRVWGFWHTSGMMALRGARRVGRGVVWGAVWACGVTWAWGVVAMGGQEADAGTPTLQAYADLVQVPVLVLTEGQRSMPPVKPNRFAVSLDGGPWFRAVHVRQEGDDAISLGVLLDVNGDEAEVMPGMADAVAGLARDWLGKQDRVSVYAMGCTLVRSEYYVPADAATLRAGVDHALATWRAAKAEKHAKRCARRANLLDSVAYVTGEMRSMAGPRVLLVVTDGIDGGSARTWKQVRAAAESAGVAVFAMSAHLGFGHIDSPRGLEAEDEFRLMCEASGGMVMPAGAADLEKAFERFAALVRERYIVEFPRPYNGTGGEHSMVVRIDSGESYVVRAAGISVPVEMRARRAILRWFRRVRRTSLLWGSGGLCPRNERERDGGGRLESEARAFSVRVGTGGKESWSPTLAAKERD